VDWPKAGKTVEQMRKILNSVLIDAPILQTLRDKARLVPIATN